jgi:nicotinate-nucleotide--dimethylbenzimidazole phosphoribosyltransferase
MSIFTETVAAIRPLDADAMQHASERQHRLTKPQGALGRLETLSIQLAGITGTPRPRIAAPTIVVAAGSHGVAAEGVSAYPATVTAQMVQNFLAGGAAINVLADQAQARLLVVDAGVDAELPQHPRLRRVKVAAGTRNLLREAAMPLEHAQQIVTAGIELAWELSGSGVDLLGLGEMGIGNTTAAAAIVAAALQADVVAVTGRGTAIDDRQLVHKREVIAQAIERHRPDPLDGWALLHTLGGYEIALLAGCCLGAAARRVPIVMDGYITTAAALIAVRLCPDVRDYLIASHRSVEPGHKLALEHLGLEPLLDLHLRLGEGSGAALAIPIVVAAARILDEMATFEQAGVDEQSASNHQRNGAAGM